MYNDTQMMKGLLEGCLLGIASQMEIYGYKAVELLNEYGFVVNEATVYPILTRLEIKGFLKTEKKPSTVGPTRKYYSITPSGQAYLAAFKHEWEKISGQVNRVLEG